MESEKVREYIMVLWNLSKKVPKICEITFFTKNLQKEMQFEWHILVATRSITIGKKNIWMRTALKFRGRRSVEKFKKRWFYPLRQPLFMALFFPFIALLSFELMMAGISTLKGYLNLLCSPSVPTYTMLCIVWI